jgi:hypothetical protein
MLAAALSLPWLLTAGRAGAADFAGTPSAGPADPGAGGEPAEGAAAPGLLGRAEELAGAEPTATPAPAPTAEPGPTPTAGPAVTPTATPAPAPEPSGAPSDREPAVPVPSPLPTEVTVEVPDALRRADDSDPDEGEEEAEEKAEEPGKAPEAVEPDVGHDFHFVSYTLPEAQAGTGGLAAGVQGLPRQPRPQPVAGDTPTPQPAPAPTATPRPTPGPEPAPGPLPPPPPGPEATPVAPVRPWEPEPGPDWSWAVPSTQNILYGLTSAIPSLIFHTKRIGLADAIAYQPRSIGQDIAEAKLLASRLHPDEWIDVTERSAIYTGLTYASEWVATGFTKAMASPTAPSRLRGIRYQSTMPGTLALIGTAMNLIGGPLKSALTSAGALPAPTGQDEAGLPEFAGDRDYWVNEAYDVATVAVPSAVGFATHDWWESYSKARAAAAANAAPFLRQAIAAEQRAAVYLQAELPGAAAATAARAEDLRALASAEMRHVPTSKGALLKDIGAGLLLAGGSRLVSDVLSHPSRYPGPVRDTALRIDDGLAEVDRVWTNPAPGSVGEQFWSSALNSNWSDVKVMWEAVDRASFDIGNHVQQIIHAGDPDDDSHNMVSAATWAEAEKGWADAERANQAMLDAEPRSKLEAAVHWTASAGRFWDGLGEELLGWRNTALPWRYTPEGEVAKPAADQVADGQAARNQAGEWMARDWAMLWGDGD